MTIDLDEASQLPMRTRMATPHGGVAGARTASVSRETEAALCGAPALQLLRSGGQLPDPPFIFFRRIGLVQHDCIERSEFADPFGAGQCPARIGVAGLPTD
jgi:hypothetical protein